LPIEAQADYDHSVAAVRTALGEEAFAAAWTEGRALSPEQAVCAALALEEIPTAGRQGSAEDPGVTGPIRSQDGDQ
jgi:hypothetical protein